MQHKSSRDFLQKELKRVFAKSLSSSYVAVPSQLSTNRERRDRFHKSST